MNRKTATLLSIIGLLLILLLCLWVNRGKIEQDLTSRSLESLQSGGFGQAQVELSGRDLILTGEAASKDDVARAAEIAGKVYGVRTVSNNMTVAAPPAVEEPPKTEEPAPLPEKLQKKQSEINAFLVGKRIEFDLSSANIRARSFPILDQIAKIVKSEAEGTITIGGHTDSQGDATFNQSLSEKRAQAVRRYLISKGVDASRLLAVGYGESKPIADNNTASGREHNRRVEFKFNK